MNWSLITNIILAASFAVLAVFVILALYQWFSRKSLQKVDDNLKLFPLPLAFMLTTYLVFDKLWILNTRPDGSGEPSFPSTHTMIVATIFFLAALNLPKYVKNTPLRLTLYTLMLILIILVSLGRVLADKHWPSDVLAALIFALIFAALYLAAARFCLKRRHSPENML